MNLFGIASWAVNIGLFVLILMAFSKWKKLKHPARACLPSTPRKKRNVFVFLVLAAVVALPIADIAITQYVLHAHHDEFIQALAQSEAE